MAAVLLAAGLALALAAGASSEGVVRGPNGRLVEKELKWDGMLLTEGPPLIDPPKRIAGYFKLNRTHDARMFYFYFQSRHKPATDPTVLWMTGGPGCSSEIAIFFENGPYSVAPGAASLVDNPYGWDAYHNMIFVDQPIGTGFSYSTDSRDRVYDEKGVAADMLDFLYEFYAAHPEIMENPFYVTGESYAGHYVPAVSSAVYRSNELGQGPFLLPLAGLAIGNGMTHPATQFPAYADYALANGLIDQSLHDSIQWWMPLCRWGADFCNAHPWRLLCEAALVVCQMTSFERILGANPDINVYDITKTCDGPLCYDMSAADDFLNRPEVRSELGVGSRSWSECDMGVNGDFMGDWLLAYDQLLPAMLDDGIRIMVYAGDLDLICNWIGNERWVDALEWSRSEEWPSAAAADWAVSGAAAGSVRELGPLSFVRVYKAGHMVPMDQPVNALAMLWRFTRNQSLTAPPEQLDPSLRALLDGAAADRATRDAAAAAAAGGAAVPAVPAGRQPSALRLAGGAQAAARQQQQQGVQQAVAQEAAALGRKVEAGGGRVRQDTRAEDRPQVQVAQAAAEEEERGGAVAAQ